MHSVDKDSTCVEVLVKCSNCQNTWLEEYHGGIGIERAEELACEEKCPKCGS